MISNSSVSVVMMSKGEKPHSFRRFINCVSQNETFEDMNTPPVLHGSTERFESLRECENLDNLFVEGFFEDSVFGAGLFDLCLTPRLDIQGIRHLCHFPKSSSRFLILLNGPLLRFSTSATNSGLSCFSSTGCQSCSSIHSKSSLDSGSFSMNLRRISSLRNFSASENIACRAISVHLISGCLLMSFSNSDGTDNVMFTESPYLCGSHNYLKMLEMLA